ncbi:cell division protein ZapA [Granulicatella balaenopterae]|uniref:Cell division protein ZapA n=1 Tax=Granulicatella balaenopterae TaxID=137733 RepID=A0A1H9N8I7_9LACT|nr:cell division protein ZapA [Granulicatella balaenopterae]SER32242.1 cell division protein ZapA [Granulicatella balaenopterae]
MTQNKQRHRARIGEKTYTIIGKKSTKHMQTVTDMLNEQLDQLTTLAPNLSLQEKMVLLAVNATSVQLEKQQEVNQLQEEIKQLKKELVGR